MKVYICYRVDWCEAQYPHPIINDKERPWIAFTDEEEAKKWVANKMKEFKKELEKHNYYNNFEAGYQEAELLEKRRDTEFKDDKTKPIEDRVLAAIDYYYSNGEPFRERELLDQLDWQIGEEYTKTSEEFYPILGKLLKEQVIREKAFDTGKGFDLFVYWKNINSRGVGG